MLVYVINGIQDDGTPMGLNKNEIYKSIDMFKNISKIINCNINKMRLYKKNDNYILTIRVNKNIY